MPGIRAFGDSSAFGPSRGRLRVALTSLAGRFATWSGTVGISWAAVVSCAEPPPKEALSLGQNSQEFVNGGDDRREYFELTEQAQRSALERFTVALMTDTTAAAVVTGRVETLPTWGRLNDLCDGEPFADQPVAAFCSGVLVDHDLVLTSGHCVNVIPIELLRVGFGYYYRDAGDIALTEDDIYEVERVVLAQRDAAMPNDDAERLDFAWLQLKDRVQPPHRPAPIHARSSGAIPNDRVISIGAGGGVPMKWDAGGRVQSIRADYDDYFVADTDTSQGSSGGGIFDANLALLGNLARGAPDFELTQEGCYVTRVENDPSAAQEQFTYAHRAVEALCATGSDSALCDPMCPDPCDAGAPDPGGLDANASDVGCAMGRPGAPYARRPLELLIAFALVARWRRRRRRAA